MMVMLAIIISLFRGSLLPATDYWKIMGGTYGIMQMQYGQKLLIIRQKLCADRGALIKQHKWVAVDIYYS